MVFVRIQGSQRGGGSDIFKIVLIPMSKNFTWHGFTNRTENITTNIEITKGN